MTTSRFKKSSWQPIPEALASLHPLYGMGGVVCYFAGYLILCLVVSIWSLFWLYGATDYYANYGHASDFARATAAVWAELVGYVVILGLLLTRSRHFIVAALIIVLACIVLSLVGTANIDVAMRAMDATYSKTPWWPGILFLFLLPVYTSRRIRVTTRHEVLKDDPILNVVQDPGEVTDTSVLAAVVEKQCSQPTAPGFGTHHAPLSSSTIGAEPPTTTELAAIDPKVIYAKITDELDSGDLDRALWTQAFAEADGDATRTRAAYIRYRAVELRQTNSSLRTPHQQSAGDSNIAERDFIVKEEKRASSEPDSVAAQSTAGRTQAAREDERFHAAAITSKGALGPRRDEPAPKASSAPPGRTPVRLGASRAAAQSVQDTAKPSASLEAGVPAANRKSGTVIIVLLVVGLLVLGAIVTNKTGTSEVPLVAQSRPPSTPAENVAPQGAAPHAPSLPGPTMAERLRDYAAHYPIMEPAHDDETRLARVTGESNGADGLLIFEYELTALGQEQYIARRLASDEELRARMVSVMCGDRERREFVARGAQLSTVLHRFPDHDLLAYVIRTADCE